MFIIILSIVLIGGWMLSKTPFETKINQTIVAKIYKDGVIVQDTTVIINGEKSNYLFADKQYYEGQFIVEYYERTSREGMKAYIEWNNDFFKEQRIVYHQYATSPSLKINQELLINKEMKEFALGLQDGTIIATSDEMHQNYINNFNIIK